jgi:O-antigen biosynthesis protein
LKISIIIVSYNVKYFLEQALHSVSKALTGIEGEIFVVDNNSVDGSSDMVRTRFPDVKLIENKKNVGFSAANNQAIRQSSGEYILLLNPDTVVEEDTFAKVITFMDEHPQAGGLGVKMIDGSGKFLPESKRGLPSPDVAFYKIFGLSALFPRSKTFGRYHLGYLNKNEIHEVEILSGAFMLIRKSVLDKTGLLDEDYFMYGEDIDISYRILKAGYKNYYFPKTKIIHYKGESTKKSSINYVFVFYRAMAIFARKHFSEKNAKIFSLLINIAIYIRAAAAVISRFFSRVLLPFTDAALIFAGMFLLKEYWETNIKFIEADYYPVEFMQIAVPSYIIIWIISIFLSGGYDKPVNLNKIVRGIATGTIVILVIYALLPESFRFSRALILLGAVWAAIAAVGLRLFLNLLNPKEMSLSGRRKKKMIIVGNETEAKRILSLLKLSETETTFIGYVTPENNGIPKPSGEFSYYHLGHSGQISDIINAYNVDEVIFCAGDISSAQIIEKMYTANGRNIEYKIAPPESLYIIGSSSVDNPGELYLVDINSITRTENRRKKRLFDVISSIIILILSPVLMFIVKNPVGLFKNIFNVFTGKLTWVSTGSNLSANLKKGILTPADAIRNLNLDEQMKQKLNTLYTKDYKVNNDMKIILRGFKSLGGKIK